MTTPITRPCPHCQQPYDITRRLNGDQCWCPCGKWFRVVIRLHGQVYLVKCDAPPGTEPAQDISADAALVAEMSALRAELEAAKEDNAALLIALREIDSSEWLPPRVQCQLDLIRQAEHPGRALMAELTKRMSGLERERDEWRQRAEGIAQDRGEACQQIGQLEYQLQASQDRERALGVIIGEMLSEFSREMRHVPHDQEQRWRRAAGLSEIKESDQ